MNTRKFNREDIDEIRDLLLNGGIVAFPTDTVFGLGCVYDDSDAIRRIYEAKGRNFTKPLPMMCNSLEMIKEVAVVFEDTEKIIKAFTPGPLTIIFNKKHYSENELKTIGIRIPNDKWILELIDKVNKPLLVTSANLSDKGSLKNWEDVYSDMNGRIDGIVMADALSDLPSTIIDMTGELKVIREGAISKDEIMECLS